jgi:hypothetical protein
MDMLTSYARNLLNLMGVLGQAYTSKIQFQTRERILKLDGLDASITYLKDDPSGIMVPRITLSLSEVATTPSILSSELMKKVVCMLLTYGEVRLTARSGSGPGAISCGNGDLSNGQRKVARLEAR